jgi:preprotein translocase subunit SecF
LLFDKEFTLPIVAAFLTIIGYSLNDTIVIFDRIRENLRRLRKTKLDDLINLSLNQTISRTILTSLTTLIVVLSLFFLGGAVIHDFSFALTIGIFVGTYSSIYIASPVLLLWEKYKTK